MGNWASSIDFVLLLSKFKTIMFLDFVLFLRTCIEPSPFLLKENVRAGFSWVIQIDLLNLTASIGWSLSILFIWGLYCSDASFDNSWWCRRMFQLHINNSILININFNFIAVWLYSLAWSVYFLFQYFSSKNWLW